MLKKAYPKNILSTGNGLKQLYNSFFITTKTQRGAKVVSSCLRGEHKDEKDLITLLWQKIQPNL